MWQIIATIVFLGQLTEGRLHDTTPQAKHQVQGRFFLDIGVCESEAILQQRLVQVRRDVLLVLDFGFHTLNGITGLDLEGDGLAHQGLCKDLLLYLCHKATTTMKPLRYLVEEKEGSSMF